MTKNQVLALFAAFLLGAFWVWPSMERSSRHSGPPPVAIEQNASIPRIQRTRATIRPVRVKPAIVASKIRTVASTKKKSLHSTAKPKFQHERRPTSLPPKKFKKHRDAIA